MIDSHCHLIWECFENNIDNVIKKAQQAGVKQFIHPCVELKDLPSMIALQSKYPEILHIAGGVHPCHADTWTNSPTNPAQDILDNWQDKIIAIGETGLDYVYKSTISLDIQEESFRAQCKLSKQLNLPLIIHCRDAFEHTYKILQEEQITNAVMHCYTGNYEWAMKFIDLGLYISYSGILTYKNAKDIQHSAIHIPVERILIETDAPFLAPQSHRGKTCQPEYILETAMKLASLRDMPLASIQEITSNNTIRLFNL